MQECNFSEKNLKSESIAVLVGLESILFLVGSSLLQVKREFNLALKISFGFEYSKKRVQIPQKLHNNCHAKQKTLTFALSNELKFRLIPMSLLLIVQTTTMNWK